MAVAMTSTPAAVTLPYRWLRSLGRGRNARTGEWHAAPAAGASAQAGLGAARPRPRAAGLGPGAWPYRRGALDRGPWRHTGRSRVRRGWRAGRRADREPPRMALPGCGD